MCIRKRETPFSTSQVRGCVESLRGRWLGLRWYGWGLGLSWGVGMVVLMVMVL